MSDATEITGDETEATGNGTERLERWHGRGWIFLLWLAVAVCAPISSRPDVFDGPLDAALFGAIVVVMLAGGTLMFTEIVGRVGSWGRTLAAAATLGTWTVLMMLDDRWALATFAIYAICFSFRPRLGVLLAAYVSAVWAVTLLMVGAPLWAMVMPLGVFAVSSILAITIHRIGELNARKSELISELRATQRDLVDAERTKGVLAERTRMAAEIHDTLAQGFTSIVLLSRAGMRSGDATEALKSIEETAQENLADARRLIEAIRPPELGAGSLTMALERQLDSVLPDAINRRFAVEGEPRALNGAVEVTVLRAAQEALLNIRTHAKADEVEMVLRFTDDAVTLDISDDGVGFTPGDVSDRGELTGGQGLLLLRRRAESLSGHLRVGPAECRGSRVTLSLPVVGP